MCRRSHAVALVAAYVITATGYGCAHNSSSSQGTGSSTTENYDIASAFEAARLRGTEMLTEANLPGTSRPQGVTTVDSRYPIGPDAENPLSLAQRYFEPDIRRCITNPAHQVGAHVDSAAAAMNWIDPGAEDRTVAEEEVCPAWPNGFFVYGFGIEADFDLLHGSEADISIRLEDGSSTPPVTLRVTTILPPDSPDLPDLSVDEWAANLGGAAAEAIRRNNAANDEANGQVPQGSTVPLTLDDIRQVDGAMAQAQGLYYQKVYARYDLDRMPRRDEIIQALAAGKPVLFQIWSPAIPSDHETVQLQGSPDRQSNPSMIWRLFVPEYLLPGRHTGGSPDPRKMQVIFAHSGSPGAVRERSSPIVLNMVRDRVIDIGVLGDSIAWAQGNTEGLKAYSLVGQGVAQALRTGVRIHRFSRSGAGIAPEEKSMDGQPQVVVESFNATGDGSSPDGTIIDGSDVTPRGFKTKCALGGINGPAAGEVPLYTPLIGECQATAVTNPLTNPTPDLIIMDGCINDLGNKIDFLSTYGLYRKLFGDNKEFEYLQNKCNTNMQTILRQIAERTKSASTGKPNTKIVVFQPPQIVSDASDTNAMTDVVIGPAVDDFLNTTIGVLVQAHIIFGMGPIGLVLLAFNPEIVNDIIKESLRFILHGLLAMSGDALMDDMHGALDYAAKEINKLYAESRSDEDKSVMRTADVKALFTPEHASFAPKSRWWDLPGYVPSMTPVPIDDRIHDDMAAERKSYCGAVCATPLADGSCSSVYDPNMFPYKDASIMSTFLAEAKRTCHVASMLHPNNNGQRALAEAILVEVGQLDLWNWNHTTNLKTLRINEDSTGTTMSCQRDEENRRAYGTCYWDDTLGYNCTHRRLDRVFNSASNCIGVASARYNNCDDVVRFPWLCRATGPNPVGYLLAPPTTPEAKIRSDLDNTSNWRVWDVADRSVWYTP